MKKIFIFAALITSAHTALAVDEATALALAKKNNCLICHSVEKKLVGPAWRDIGKKYGSDTTATELLLAKIKKGGKGTWGAVAMPPNAAVKDEDIKEMVAYIMSLK